MSVNKIGCRTPAHHHHATPKPAMEERPHGHKEDPPQVIPMTNVTPGDSPFVTWDQFQYAMSVIRTVIGGTVESGATIPILPEDGSTMQAFLLRIERRYTQMGLEPCEWGNALIDHLVGLALTYWMYLRRTIDLNGWATVQRRLLERFDKTMSQSQLLTELAKGRGHPARVCPSKGERTKRPGEMCKKCGGVGHYARDCPTYEQGRPDPVDKSSPNAIPVSLEWGNQLLRTAERTNTSDGHAEGTQPLSETRRESGSASILSEETPDATADSRRKSAEPTEDGYRSDATEIVPHW
ncbi:hypothetical protein ENH_00020610 [Eimeria necatrix]|uniref:CCHC-type domain-containing protein n=1 Tax=Eimeria necatrix TaxID=51315 RepID=U6MLP9_9EIME|nr:hypothetical protein ENH_00020610 [Eimeria necatrix]CDJ62555.1 hypothetical protein ENH_00020610 [Eimeria necatrix]